MERALKERLVGAAVLMAAAVILIPEMLSGPRRPATPQPVVTPDKEADPGEGTRKRYTIDMQRPEPPAEVASGSTVIEEPAPPPEDIVEIEPQAQTPPPPAETDAASSPPPETVAATEPAPQPTAEPPAPTPTPAAAVAESPPPTAKPAPAAATPAAERRWAVRLIAFSADKRAEAQRMAEDLRDSNLAAFVLPVQTKNGTLYSVRIGPFAKREEAEAALRSNKVKAVSTSPEVVTQP